MLKDDIYNQFECYYNEYVEYIRRYCYYKLNDYPDYAEDCVQDTFRVLFEQLSKDTKLEYPKQFLIKTASNFVKLKFRDIDKEKNKNFSMNQTDFDIPIEQEFFKVDYDVIVRLKNEILSELSESERILLSKTCKNYKNSYQTTKQLAAEYNCSETCIRQRIFILRRKIKCLVKEKTKKL